MRVPISGTTVATIGTFAHRRSADWYGVGDSEGWHAPSRRAQRAYGTRRRMKHADLIVARMERARQDRGISVAELGRRIGVDRKRLWYVLNGQRSMHVDEFVRL